MAASRAGSLISSCEGKNFLPASSNDLRDIPSVSACRGTGATDSQRIGLAVRNREEHLRQVREKGESYASRKSISDLLATLRMAMETVSRILLDERVSELFPGVSALTLIASITRRAGVEGGVQLQVSTVLDDWLPGERRASL